MGLILIVDDLPVSATALELACSGIPGTDVRSVPSALDALEVLEEADVSAVITDLRMPGMSGLQLIEFIRAHRRYGATPVIAVTADTDPEIPGRLKRAGANAYFSKPFSSGAVRQTLERLLHEQQT